MKRLSALSLILLTSLLAALGGANSGSPPQWLWAKPLPGGALAADRSGNAYLSGQFTGTLALGTTNLTAQGFGDLYVAKTDPDGVVLWARQARGYVNGLDVALDSMTNIYVAGSFQGVLNFGATNVDSGYFTWVAGFLAKYDRSGNFLWVRTSGVSESSDTTCRSVAVDLNDQVVIAGHMRPGLSFGSQALPGYDDAFLVKFNGAGGVVWQQKIGGIYTNTWNWHVVTDVAFDATGNIHVTGAFSHNARFGAVELASGGNTDIFVAKYSPAGVLLWVRQAGSASDERDEDAPLDIGRSIAVDSLGSVYVTGTFDYPGALFGATNLVATEFEGGAFLAKYDANGNLLWVRQGDGSAQVAWNVQLDRADDVYAVGRELSPTFVSKFDGAGNLHWAQGTSPASAGMVSSFMIGRDGLGYVSGNYPRLAQFGNTTLTNRFGTFVAKLDRTFPRLHISLASNSIAIAWPAAATDYELRGTHGFTPPAWLPVAGTGTVSGTLRIITIARTNAGHFFRLMSIVP